MNIVKRITNLSILVVLTSVSTYSIGSESKTSFEDLPEYLQTRIWLEARPELEAWLLGMMKKIFRGMITR